MSTPIIPGAEPIFFPDGLHGGVLLLHGYTGTPQQIRPWAEAFAQAGFAVEAPLLPGHGTIAEDMVDTRWSDYVDCADAAYQKLAARYQHVFVGGLCLGGSMAAWLTIQHPATAGLIVVNGHFKPPRAKSPESVLELLRTGKQFFVWPTLPKQVEDPQAPAVLAYNKVPIAPMRSLEPAREEICRRFPEIHTPVLAFSSLLSPKDDQDDTWFEQVSGPVQHIMLEHSNSIATLDYDKEMINASSVAFALAITRGEQARWLENSARPLVSSGATSHQRQASEEFFPEQYQVSFE